MSITLDLHTTSMSTVYISVYINSAEFVRLISNPMRRHAEVYEIFSFLQKDKTKKNLSYFHC